MKYIHSAAQYTHTYPLRQAPDSSKCNATIKGVGKGGKKCKSEFPRHSTAAEIQTLVGE